MQESVSPVSLQLTMFYFVSLFSLGDSCLDDDHKKPSFTETGPVRRPMRRIENVPQPDSCTVFIQHTINSFPHLLV